MQNEKLQIKYGTNVPASCKRWSIYSCPYYPYKYLCRMMTFFSRLQTAVLCLFLFIPGRAYMEMRHMQPGSDYISGLPDGKQPLIVVTGKNEPGGIGFQDRDKAEIECALKILYGTELYKEFKQRLTIPLICIVNTKDENASSTRARVTNVGYLYMPASYTSNVAAVMSSLVAEIENLLNCSVYESLNDRAKSRDGISKTEFVSGYFNAMARATYQTLKFQDKNKAFDDKRYNNSQLKRLYKDFKSKKLYDPKKPKVRLTEAQFMNDIITPFLETSNQEKKSYYESIYDQYINNSEEKKTAD